MFYQSSPRFTNLVRSIFSHVLFWKGLTRPKGVKVKIFDGKTCHVCAQLEQVLVFWSPRLDATDDIWSVFEADYIYRRAGNSLLGQIMFSWSNRTETKKQINTR